MNESNCVVFNWNVRGLNGVGRRQEVKDMVNDHRATIVCLQETKLDMVNDVLINEILGHQFVGGICSIAC